MDAFWQVIENARRKAGEDDAATAEIITQKLRDSFPGHLDAFREFFTSQADLLNTPPFRAEAAKFWMLSEEGWLHFRAWLVSRGAEIFHALRKNPKFLGTVAEHFPDVNHPPNGKRFLSCADDAEAQQRGVDETRN